jgi:hypothetical protein
MELDILKDLIARAAFTRKDMYARHEVLKAQRTSENFELFVKSVDDFNTVLKELPQYMRIAPICYHTPSES